MKQFISTAMLAAAFVSTSAFASGLSDMQMQQIRMASLQAFAANVQPLYMVNWKVGDTADFSLTLSSLPVNGTETETVTKDEGTTLWFEEVMDLQIEKETADIQIDKNTGKILQMTVNGQAQTIPDGAIKVIKQEYTSITVPAGTFKCVHIVAQETTNGTTSNVEMWANPTDTVMEGTLKEIADTGSMGTMTTELTSFKHGQ